MANEFFGRGATKQILNKLFNISKGIWYEGEVKRSRGREGEAAEWKRFSGEEAEDKLDGYCAKD